MEKAQKERQREKARSKAAQKAIRKKIAETKQGARKREVFESMFAFFFVFWEEETCIMYPVSMVHVRVSSWFTRGCKDS